MKAYGCGNRADPDFPWLECGEYFPFPDPDEAHGSVVAVGGNLSPGMMLSAYAQGVFPWFNEDDPLYWQSPNPRFVLMPQDLHIPSRLAREMKKGVFTITADTVFEEVVLSCAEIMRPGQQGTWITEDLMDACIGLHGEGFMHSIEAWDGDRLAGGFYGLQLGPVFFGESMFTRRSGASKTAFAVFARTFFSRMGGALIDSQVYTDHVARFGAKNISRQAYLRFLKDTLAAVDPAFAETGVPSAVFQEKQRWRDFFPAEKGSPSRM